MIFILFFFLAASWAQLPPTRLKIYSKPYAGAEILSLDSGSEIRFSYAANLHYAGNGTLWFTSEKGFPNLRTAYFNEKQPLGPDNFWMYPVPFPPKNEIPPFLSFEVLPRQDGAGDSIIGISYPLFTSDTKTGLEIQNLHLNGYASHQVAFTTMPGYEFVSIIAGPEDNNHISTIYLAGWANDLNTGSSGLVVARARAPINEAFGPVIVDWTTDVSAPIENFACYDIFDTMNKPSMWFTPDQTELVIGIPGRCSFFAKFKIPTEQEQWSEVIPQTLDPRLSSDQDHFVAGMGMDHTGNVWFISKKFDSEVSYIKWIDVKAWAEKIENFLVTLGEADMLVIPGKHGDENNMFIVGIGSGRIYRINVNGATYPYAYASLPKKIDTVSSGVYIEPFLYFTTYEPAGDLARIHINNFCEYWCGDYGWCDNGKCACEDGYAPVMDNGRQEKCIPAVIHKSQVEVADTSSATAVMAVLFAFSSVIAVAGWYSWHRAKTDAEKYGPLVTPPLDSTTGYQDL